MTNICDVRQQEHKRFLFAVRNFSPRGQRSSGPRRPCEDSFVVNNDESIPESDYPANEGWQWQEDIQAWANRHHVLSAMGFKFQKQNQPNPPRQDSPVPSFPRQKTPRQPTPGLSGTQWSEDLFRKPSQTNEPSIPGLSPSSKPH
ncbi:hypothetical protein O181_083488 [Austropuccinia psidii MF-1]|uniref:Uncharacterized protein n=1 Tax=Austropuccinia psidii MF-1 TaxID=1389203 RepID=A0A9Q3IJL6_9BASI|nr:hypothetical protein [Austropuccinia psidii MF-1]